MPLPVNVAVCTVTGAFVNTDGSIAVGSVEFTPVPMHIANVTSDPPLTLIGAPVRVDLFNGAFAVDLPATDDPDLNPVDFLYLCRVRISNQAAYSFYMAAPAGVLDLAGVTPPPTTEMDVVLVAGPSGPPGPAGEPGIEVADTPPADTEVLWADTTVEGVAPSMTVAVFTYTDEGDARPDADVVFWIPDPYSLPNPMGALVGDLVLRTTPDVITGLTGTSGIWTGTVTEFDSLASYDPTVIYFVTADP